MLVLVGLPLATYSTGNKPLPATLVAVEGGPPDVALNTQSQLCQTVGVAVENIQITSKSMGAVIRQDL
jgi:hypothetical protein